MPHKAGCHNILFGHGAPEKITRIILLATVFAVLVSLFGVTVRATAAPLPGAIRTLDNNTLLLGLGALHQAYHEEDFGNQVPTGYLDKENGEIPLASAEWRYLITDKVYTALRFTYADGKTNYHGYLQQVNYNGDSSSAEFTPYGGSTDNRIYGLSYDAGYLFPFGQRFTLMPLMEIGYGHWDRMLQGRYGYDENYDRVRIGVGLQLDMVLSEKLVFELSGVYAEQKAHINAPVLNANLGTNPYTRVGVLLDYRVSPRIHIGLRAERIHYRFSRSDTNSVGFLEPPSATTHSRILAQLAVTL